MLNRAWLLGTAVIALAGPVLGAELPAPKKLSFYETRVGACRASLLDTPDDIRENMARILFCVDANHAAMEGDGKLLDPKFVGALARNNVAQLLAENYVDSGGRKVESYVKKINAIASPGDTGKKFAASLAKSKAKDTIKSAKKDLKGVKDAAMQDMLSAFEKDQGKACVEASGIELLGKRTNYGEKNVDKYAKEPFGPVFFRQSNASEANIKNLGFMLKAMRKLAANPADIPDNPKFIKAAAKTVEDYWSQEDCYGVLDESGYKSVAELVSLVARVSGALKVYNDTLEGRTSDLNRKISQNTLIKENSKSILAEKGSRTNPKKDLNEGKKNNTRGSASSRSSDDSIGEGDDDDTPPRFGKSGGRQGVVNPELRKNDGDDAFGRRVESETFDPEEGDESGALDLVEAFHAMSEEEQSMLLDSMSEEEFEEFKDLVQSAQNKPQQRRERVQYEEDGGIAD